MSMRPDHSGAMSNPGRGYRWYAGKNVLYPFAHGLSCKIHILTELTSMLDFATRVLLLEYLVSPSESISHARTTCCCCSILVIQSVCISLSLSVSLARSVCTLMRACFLQTQPSS